MAVLKMHCIFCKQDSSNSVSVEHIVPESLGNDDHVLPAGVVCDKCNNYIAREIEKPLLDSVHFRGQRFYSGIPNKKDRIPPIDGFHIQSGTSIRLVKSVEDGGISICAAHDADESCLAMSLHENERGALIIPVGKTPSPYVLSRFLGKMGLEAFAYKVLDVPGGIDEIINHPCLDELRSYVRYGNRNIVWPYSHRPLYWPDHLFVDDNDPYQVLHEFDVLITPAEEYYFVIAIFGDEYSINLGGPEIGGYMRWLEENNNKSPLYFGRNA